MITTKIALVLSVCFWFVICMAVYRRFRGAAWLAASTAASCLFFLGATVAASLLVKGAMILVPIWVALAVLIAVHLLSAHSERAKHFSSKNAPAIRQGDTDLERTSAVTSRSEPEMYI